MTTRLTVIGGYLGAGKSTVVNRLLTGGALGRTAVVVNDFGSVNIDARLVAAASEDTIELTNGCICCQISDDVGRVMTMLAARDDLDGVICEVSGVGDPAQLSSWGEYPGFSRGPVLVCADATSLPQLLRDEYVGETAARQLKSADIVLLTKTDLATPSQIREAYVRAGAAAVRAQVRIAPLDSADLAEIVSVPSPAGQGGTDDGGHLPVDQHAAAHDYLTIELPVPVDPDAVARILERHCRVLARAKGVLFARDGASHEVHGASGRVTVRRLPPSTFGSGPRTSTLVLIAAGPDRAAALAAVHRELDLILGAGPAAPG